MGAKEENLSFSLDELLDEAKQYQTENNTEFPGGDEALDSLLKELHTERILEDLHDYKINDNTPEIPSSYETEQLTQEPEPVEENEQDDLGEDEIVEEAEKAEEDYSQPEDTEDKKDTENTEYTSEEPSEDGEEVLRNFDKIVEAVKEDYRKASQYGEYSPEEQSDIYEDSLQDDPADFIYDDEKSLDELDGDNSEISDFIQRLEQSNKIDEAKDEYIKAIEAESKNRRKEKSQKPGRKKHGFFMNLSSETDYGVTSSMAGNFTSDEYEDESQSEIFSAKIARSADYMQICTGVLCAMTLLSFLAGAIPQAIASMVNIETALSAFGGSATFYLVSNLVLTLCSCIFGLPVLVNGFKSLVKRNFCADTGVTLAMVLCLVQNLLFLFTDSLKNENVRLMSCVAIFSLFMLTVSRLLNLRQLQDQFEFITADEPLYNAMYIKNKRDSAEIGKGILSAEPNLRYSAEIKFPLRFIETVLEPLPNDKTMRHLLPPALLAGIAVGAVTWLLSGSFLTGFTALTAMVCLSVPAAATLADIFPLYVANNSLSKVRAGIPSCRTAVKCAETDGVILDAKEIFKDGGTVSPNFKPFKMNRIDEALLNAAALTSSIDGPLAESFKSMIITNHTVMPTVRDAHYVDALGIEGKVNGRSVLFGSRELMEQRGIAMPPQKDERQYKRDGRRLLYLSQSGILTAMFVVIYQANRTAGASMRRIAKEGVTVLVRSDDPGITESFIEEVFHLPQNSVKVLRGDAGALYRDNYEKEINDEADVSVMHRGRLISFLSGITSCFALKRTFALSRLVEQAGLGIGIALFALLSFMSPNLAGASQIFMYQLIFAAVNLLLPLRRKK